MLLLPVLPLRAENVAVQVQRNDGQAKPEDPPYSVTLRRNAFWALRQFGPEAKPAVPKLVQLLSDVEAAIRSEATNALKAIDPQAAAQAGVK